MKEMLKKAVKKFLPYKLKMYGKEYLLDCAKKTVKTSLTHKVIGLIRFIYHNKLIFIPKNHSQLVCEAYQLEQILRISKIAINGEYIYPFDPHIIRIKEVAEILSLTPDYGIILDSSLDEIAQNIKNLKKNTDFYTSLLLTINSISSFSTRISFCLREEYDKSRNQRYKLLSEYFKVLVNQKPRSFDEAIQKILFYNALFWQNRHYHNGLGRLDKILYPYYIKDIEAGILTEKDAKKKLIEFIQLLGRDTRYKSPQLIGDTGQVILLGGKSFNGKLIENELTEMFLEIIAKLSVPDPKLILRVNNQTSNKIWQLAINSIMTGCGSPLIINEERVIPLMQSFGYNKEDCYEFGTSACWEPLIIGKSFDQNNCVRNIIPLTPLQELIFDPSNAYINFESFLAVYKNRLAKSIEKRSESIDFDCSPLLSLFFSDCILKGKDISRGGAKYNYHGMLVVGLPNLINSLLNIQEYIYKKRLFTLADCKKAIEGNYIGMQDMHYLFLNNPNKFGKSTADIISLTNEIMQTISEAVSKVKINGCRVKVGFSSPQYISESNNFPASLDGRKLGEPFGVHISPVSGNIDIAEVLKFASKIDYSGNRINGNVVDFIIPSIYLKKSDRLISILKAACKNGVFELQLNVLDKKTLINAKLHPEQYPNLVVRVWGFSAYYNDLPEEYKNNLIHRAELYGC